MSASKVVHKLRWHYCDRFHYYLACMFHREIIVTRYNFAFRWAAVTCPDCLAIKPKARKA